MNHVQKKYAILGSLCALVLTLVVGYAAFQTILKINGTTNINSNWDVKITAIEKTSSVGATDNEGSPTYDNTKGLSATFNTNLTSPGDYATYKITITNGGSLDAVLKNITIPNNTNNDIIFYLNKNQNNQDIAGALKQNDTLTKTTESNNVGYVYVTVLYKDYENQQTAQAKTVSMTISFDFEQATGSSEPIGPAGSDETTVNVVYRGSKATLNIGDSIENWKTYPTSEEFVQENNKHVFLKHEIDEENKIKASEACFIKDNVMYCLKPNEDEINKTNLVNIFGADACKIKSSSTACNDDSLGITIYNGSGVAVTEGLFGCQVLEDGSNAACWQY